MKKNNLIEFDAEILACRKKIKELEPYIEKNEACAMQYNRLLVQKAILKENRKKKTKINGFCHKIKNMLTFNHKKKLICDFFNESC